MHEDRAEIGREGRCPWCKCIFYVCRCCDHGQVYCEPEHRDAGDRRRDLVDRGAERGRGVSFAQQIADLDEILGGAGRAALEMPCDEHGPERGRVGR